MTRSFFNYLRIISRNGDRKKEKSEIQPAAKHSWTTLRMSRPLFVVSYWQVSSNEKEEKFASNDNLILGFHQQILAMRLLRAVLPSWDVTKESSRMSEVVAKLFALLGRVLMTCHGSLPIQPPSGLFCVRLKSYLTLIPFSDPVGFGLVLIGGRYSQRSPCRHLALKICKF